MTLDSWQCILERRVLERTTAHPEWLERLQHTFIVQEAEEPTCCWCASLHSAAVHFGDAAAGDPEVTRITAPRALLDELATGAPEIASFYRNGSVEIVGDEVLAIRLLAVLWPSPSSPC